MAAGHSAPATGATKTYKGVSLGGLESHSHTVTWNRGSFPLRGPPSPVQLRRDGGHAGVQLMGKGKCGRAQTPLGLVWASARGTPARSPSAGTPSGAARGCRWDSGDAQQLFLLTAAGQIWGGSCHSISYTFLCSPLHPYTPQRARPSLCRGPSTCSSWLGVLRQVTQPL